MITFWGNDKFPSLYERLLHERKIKSRYLERRIYERPLKSQPFIETQSKRIFQNYVYINLLLNVSLFTAISKTSQEQEQPVKRISLQKDFVDSYTEVLGEKHTQNEFKKKKSDKFFAARRNVTAQREKDESCTSKRRQKQGNYFEINRFSTV